MELISFRWIRLQNRLIKHSYQNVWKIIDIFTDTFYIGIIIRSNFKINFLPLINFKFNKREVFNIIHRSKPVGQTRRIPLILVLKPYPEIVDCSAFDMIYSLDVPLRNVNNHPSLAKVETTSTESRPHTATRLRVRRPARTVEWNTRTRHGTVVERDIRFDLICFLFARRTKTATTRTASGQQAKRSTRRRPIGEIPHVARRRSCDRPAGEGPTDRRRIFLGIVPECRLPGLRRMTMDLCDAPADKGAEVTTVGRIVTARVPAAVRTSQRRPRARRCGSTARARIPLRSQGRCGCIVRAYVRCTAVLCARPDPRGWARRPTCPPVHHTHAGVLFPGSMGNVVAG